MMEIVFLLLFLFTIKFLWNWAKVKPAILGYFVLGFCFILLVCTISGKLPELTIIWIAISVSAIVGTYITLKSILQDEH